MLAEIILDGDHGWMHVRFTNDTGRPQWLAKARALLGQEPDGDFLQIQPTAIYRGAVAKRLSHAEAELFEVEPGESISSDKFHLHEWYRVPSGPLSVRYHAAHPLAGEGQVRGALIPVTSEAVKVGAATAMV